MFVCGCGQKLGELRDGFVVMRHQHREVAARYMVVKCEHCGRVSELVAPVEQATFVERLSARVQGEAVPA